MWKRKVSVQNYLSFQFREAKHEKAFGKYHTYCLNLSFFNKIRPFNIQHQHFPVSTLFLQIKAQNYFYSLILSFYFFATIWPSSYFHLFCISSDHVDMEQNTRITVAFLSSRRLIWNKAASLLAFSLFPRSKWRCLEFDLKSGWGHLCLFSVQPELLVFQTIFNSMPLSIPG